MHVDIKKTEQLLAIKLSPCNLHRALKQWQNFTGTNIQDAVNKLNYANTLSLFIKTAWNANGWLCKPIFTILFNQFVPNCNAHFTYYN